MSAETLPVIEKPDKMPMNTSQPPGSSCRNLYLGVTMTIVLFILSGVFAIRGLIDRHEAQDIAQLQSIAALKAEQIRRWLDERRMDAEILHTATTLIKAIRQWQTGDDPSNGKRVIERLQTLKKIMGYQSIFVTDSEGKALFGAGGHQYVTTVLRTSLDRAFTTDQVQFTDLYHEHTGGEEHLHFDFVVPIVGIEEESKLALIMRLDKEDFLFPFLQEWPLLSASAETLLFKRDGNSILFLNELRHRSETALKLRIPLTETNVLAVQLANQKVSGKPVSGPDYRGVATIGVVYPVPGTSWCLLAKMDQAEFDAKLHRDILLISLTLFLALLAVLAGAVFLNQRKKLHWATVRQCDLAESSLDIVFQALPDLFFRMSADGIILDYRAQNNSALYAAPELFLGKRMQDILPPDVGQQFSAKMVQALDTQQLISYEYELCIAEKRHYEARLVSLNDTKQIIAVVRDITARKQAEQALIDSGKLLEEAQVLAHIGHWKLDPVTMKSVWADEIFRIFGIKPMNEVDMEFLSGLLHPDERDRVIVALGKLATQEDHQLQNRISYRPLRCRNSLGIVYLPVATGQRQWFTEC